MKINVEFSVAKLIWQSLFDEQYFARQMNFAILIWHRLCNKELDMGINAENLLV